MYAIRSYYAVPAEVEPDSSHLVVLVHKVEAALNSSEIQQAEQWTLVSPDYVATISSTSQDIINENSALAEFSTRITSYNVCYTKLLRPNPFNPSTTITYALPIQSPVVIKIYDLTGQEVITLVDEVKEAGTYEINFDALNFSSGVYIYQMRAGDFSSVKKMSVLK